MSHVPWALVALRLALGPVLAALVLVRAPWPWTVGTLVVAVASDVFDGVLARRMGAATEGLRRADSVVDTVFYVVVAAASVVVYPETFRAFAVGLGLLVSLEVVRHGVDVAKYGRTSAYHMWSAKLWGLTLLAGFAELFASGEGGALFGTAVAVGVLTNVEGLAASALLREWHHDVPSVLHALRARRAEGSHPRPASGRAPSWRRPAPRRPSPEAVPVTPAPLPVPAVFAASGWRRPRGGGTFQPPTPHPMPWSRLVGQDRPVDVLSRALASGRVAGTYLFHGAPGTGTLPAALAFAEALQCERRGRPGGPEGDACGTCLACTKARRLIHPDVHVYLPFPKVSKGADKDERPADYPERLMRLAENPYAPVDYRQRATLDEEGPSNKQVQHRKTPVDQFFRHDMTFVPVEGRHVVGVLTDADRLRTEAANSLLKLLEEPGDDVVLVLTAERVENVLPTILSRCQRVRFDPLPAATIEAALVEREGVAADRAAFVARMADGSYTRALELLGSETLGEHRALALDFVRQAYTGRPDRLAPLIERAAKLGREPLKGWLGLVTLWIRDLVLARTVGAGAPLVNVDQAEAVRNFVAALPDADLDAMVGLVAEAEGAIEGNANATLVLTALAFGLRDAMHGRAAGRLVTPLDAA